METIASLAMPPVTFPVFAVVSTMPFPFFPGGYVLWYRPSPRQSGCSSVDESFNLKSFNLKVSISNESFR